MSKRQGATSPQGSKGSARAARRTDLAMTLSGMARSLRGRQAVVRAGGEVGGFVDDGELATAREHVRTIFEALGLAASSGDLAWLAATAKAARTLLREYEHVVPLGARRGRDGHEVRDFAEYLRDEVDSLITPDAHDKGWRPASIPDLARMCAVRIGMTKGLSTDRLTRRQREALIEAALDRLGEKRRDSPNAVTLAALRACGLDEPNLFKREQMSAKRRRDRTRPKKPGT